MAADATATGADGFSGIFGDAATTGFTAGSTLLAVGLSAATALAVASGFAPPAVMPAAARAGGAAFAGAVGADAAVFFPAAGVSVLVLSATAVFRFLPSLTGAAGGAPAGLTVLFKTAAVVFPATAGIAGFVTDAAAALTASGFALTVGDLVAPAGAGLVLPAAVAPDVIVPDLAAVLAADFAGALGMVFSFEADPCARADGEFVEALTDFASFFEDAILIAP